MRPVVMKGERAVWDVVPARLVAGALATAGVCAAIGLRVPGFPTLAVGIYGAAALGLMLFGLVGCLAAPFEEGVWHGVAFVLFPPFYPIYFWATHPEAGWRPFVNMVVGYGLIWVAIRTFPAFREDGPPPARPIVAGESVLEGNDPPVAVPLTATTQALARLLAGVTDEASARKAAPRYRQLTAQRRVNFEAAGEPRALDDRGKLVSITSLLKLGPRFRDADRAFESEWKRVRRMNGLAEILEGAR